MVATSFEERIAPEWTRGLEVLIGLIAIVLAIVVIAKPVVAIITLIFFLSWALLFMGLRDIAMGMTLRWRSAAIRGLHLVTCILAIIVAFLTLAYPDLGDLILLLSFALVANGITLIVSGATGHVRIPKVAATPVGGKFP
jgi:uncharacterized membrane protein HdeD (DUF308 family)